MDARRKDKIYLAAGLIPAVLVAASAFFFVPGSIDIYEPVADKLPDPTRFVFSFYQLSALLPLFVLCIWALWRVPSQRGPLAAGIGLVASTVAFAFGWWAVYQPDLILELIEKSLV